MVVEARQHADWQHAPLALCETIPSQQLRCSPRVVSDSHAPFGPSLLPSPQPFLSPTRLKQPGRITRVRNTDGSGIFFDDSRQLPHTCLHMVNGRPVLWLNLCWQTLTWLSRALSASLSLILPLYAVCACWRRVARACVQLPQICVTSSDTRPAGFPWGDRWCTQHTSCSCCPCCSIWPPLGDAQNSKNTRWRNSRTSRRKVLRAGGIILVVK